jgi:non-heme chloroperoxidase
MTLEVLSVRPKGRRRDTPLVFVHGAYAGAWVWVPHFLPYFAEHGYAAHALSLRGHGASAGTDRLAFAGLSEYADDVAEICAGLDRPPVLIGHSMGGMIVQKYMRRHPVAAAVLMASPPPHGMIGSWLTMSLRNPGLLHQVWMMQAFGVASVDLGTIRRALFSDDTPNEAVLRYVPLFGPESAKVILDMLFLDLPPSSRWTEVPTLVIGGGRDKLVYPGAVQSTAGTYGTRAEIFDDLGHALMLDHHWERVARRILRWLEATIEGERTTPRQAVA